MENIPNINEILTYLKEKSVYFNKLSTDQNFLYQEVNNLSKEQIEYMINLYDKSDKPVVILRLVLLKELSKGNKITSDLIQTINDKFRAKDLEYFKPYLNSDQITSIEEYNGDTNPFGKWPAFRVLYALVYYGEWKKKVSNYLKIIANYLKSELNKKDYKERLIGFDGPQNQGNKELNLIIYPGTFKKYQKAVFYYLDIIGGKLFAGLGTGNENQTNVDIPKEILHKEFDVIENVVDDFRKYTETEHHLNEALHNKSNIVDISSKYWCAGTTWGEEGDKLVEFNQNKCWKIGHDKNANNKGAKQAWKSMKEVKAGDFIAFKSYGGKDDLTIRQISKITGKDEEKGEIYFEKISDEKLFKGRGLKNGTTGWFGTLFQITDPKAIETIFGESVFMLKDQTVSLAKELAKLLKESKNIILHGAPGTGKTHLAQQIADEMKAERKFVQFHPSYDYTDFVEGLRPDDKSKENGELGFRHANGVFKNFCAEAIKNSENSTKTDEDLRKENLIDEAIDSFVNDAINKKKELKITRNRFFIEDIVGDQILISVPDNFKYKEYRLPISRLRSLLMGNSPITRVKDVKELFNRSRAEDSYLLAIYNEVNEILKNRSLATASNDIPLKVGAKDYVFIIDEINRGDLSKIFGELFFAVESSHRGERVMTQYQNLIKENDPFYEGFYIPQNVYIIGTMNDIDRSVESMDFAFRRRFTFVEITADKTADAILENIDPTEREKCKNIMKGLNDKISKIKELGSPADYHIGGAYFLKLKDVDYQYDKFWEYHLKGLLKEYFRGMEDPERLLADLEKEYNELI